MADRCWVLTFEGADYVDDGTPHFLTPGAAEKFATERGLLHKPRLLDEKCVTTMCLCCGYWFDEDEHGVLHLDPGDVDELLTKWDWVKIGDEWKCPTCVTGPCDQEADTHG